MGHIFDVENPFWQFMNKMTDLFLLSLLWILFSLPVITAGAATAGFCNGAAKLYEGRETGVWRDFFAGFSKDFRTATGLWLTQLGLTAVLLADMWAGRAMDSSVGGFLFAVNGMLLVMLVCVSFYAYPVAVRFGYRVRRTWREAAAVACAYLPHTVSLLAIWVACLLAAWCVDYVVLFVPAVAGYQVVRVCVWIFSKERMGEVDGQDTSRAA